VPDAAGLETIAKEIGELGEGALVGSTHDRGQAGIEVAPRQVRATLIRLRERGFRFLSSVHGVDYYPDEPRLGVIYELIDMHAVDRISVKTRVSTEAPEVESVVDLYPGANHQEREVFDMFGVVFDGHPDLRRILMPEDYEGWPQRRDFPLGGEPVIFTHNEPKTPGWTR
jgi:NADH-quinone oxidoreductase subunit C